MSLASVHLDPNKELFMKNRLSNVSAQVSNIRLELPALWQRMQICLPATTLSYERYIGENL